MSKSKITATVSALMMIAPSLAQADSQSWRKFEGYYRPAIDDGAQWSCQARDLGQDGGSLGIIDGALHGLENRCDLKNARAANGGAVQFTAVCEGEGEQYTDEVTIAATSTGLSLSRNGQSVAWLSCDEAPASAGGEHPTNGDWVAGFGMGVTEIATYDRDGNGLTFLCTAGHDGQLEVSLAGQSAPAGQIEFDVDGKTFAMTVDGDGGAVATSCRVCADNFMGLWQAVARGELLTVKSASGLMARFSLNGTGVAMGGQACVPAE